MNAATATTFLTGLLSLCLFPPAIAADFYGSLKGVTITDTQGTNKPPVASFNYTNNEGAFNFDASGSTDPDGTITAYQWDFGNGVVGTGVTASTSYTPGIYPVTLTVIDNTKGVTLAQQKVTYSEGLVLEDAEDGTTVGWSVYDNIPAGATIANEYDSARNSRVISFTGAGWDNGFSLAKADGSTLNIKDKSTISLSFLTSERYQIYVQVSTSVGLMYLSYIGIDTNTLVPNIVNDTYIKYGLGTSSMNGTWQSITRNLATDLANAYPGVTISSVDKVLLRGTLKVDDIMLK
ncbi:MAG: PKD domain-containing protein [Desulfobulbus sp.]|nr:PKD domain-containing protein [Desulfobulbus sp.]